MKKNKVLILFLALMMIFMASCNNSKVSDEATEEAAKSVETSENAESTESDDDEPIIEYDEISFSDVFIPEARLEMWRKVDESIYPLTIYGDGTYSIGIEDSSTTETSEFAHGSFSDTAYKVTDYHYVITVSESEITDETYSSQSLEPDTNLHLYIPGCPWDEMPNYFYCGLDYAGEDGNHYDDMFEIAFNDEEKLIRPALIEEAKLDDGHAYLFCGNGISPTFVVSYFNW